MKRLFESTRIQLIIIALSLLMTTTVSGLSAYLTDMTSIESSFFTVSGEEFGVSLNGTEYSGETILPGDEIFISPTVTNSGNHAAYVFVETNFPTDFTIDHETFDSEGWTPLSDDVYYYGTNGSVNPLDTDENTTPFEGIIFNPNSTNMIGESLDITITAYAIQSKNITDTNAESVWTLAKGE